MTEQWSQDTVRHMGIGNREVVQQLLGSKVMKERVARYLIGPTKDQLVV